MPKTTDVPIKISQMMFNKNHLLSFFLALFISAQGFSLASSHEKSQNEQDVIKELYQHLPRNASLSERIQYFSETFLGTPYQLSPTGEGVNATYNTKPLYRTDRFDCLTFVETVTALATSSSKASFEKQLKALRYKDGQPNLTSRNHFTSLDWLPNNNKKGLIRDITTNIHNENKTPIYVTATTLIDKKSWFRKQTKNLVQDSTQDVLVKELYKSTDQYTPTLTPVPYLPLSTLFDESGKPNAFYFDQIPHGAILSIVRPNWQLKDKIGTNLHISHLGLTLRKDSKLYFVEASSDNKIVQKTLLSDYLKKFLDSPTVKGINVQIILADRAETFRNT